MTTTNEQLANLGAGSFGDRFRMTKARLGSAEAAESAMGAPTNDAIKNSGAGTVPDRIRSGMDVEGE